MPYNPHHLRILDGLFKTENLKSLWVNECLEIIDLRRAGGQAIARWQLARDQHDDRISNAGSFGKVIVSTLVLRKINYIREAAIEVKGGCNFLALRRTAVHQILNACFAQVAAGTTSHHLEGRLDLHLIFQLIAVKSL